MLGSIQGTGAIQNRLITELIQARDRPEWALRRVVWSIHFFCVRISAHWPYDLEVLELKARCRAMSNAMVQYNQSINQSINQLQLRAQKVQRESQALTANALSSE